jgi:signal transduction histidine kinase/DNA-binding response OmpR family regulator
MAHADQRLAFDLQQTRQALQQERERSSRLAIELERQNHELDRLRSTIQRESNSRLLAEEALDETSDRLEIAVAAAGLALWDWQLAMPLVYLTARWGEMLGELAMDGHWDTGTLVARLHPDDSAEVQALSSALRAGHQQRAVVQFRVRGAQGEWLWMECHGVVAEHNAQGQAMRLMGTLADISERKRTEQESAQARALAEQASRAKSEFLANISHEIRTPLNAIMGLNRLLMVSPLNAEQSAWLKLTDRSAHALLSLLNDVLDLSRIEAGKIEVEHVRFPLHDTLREVGALYAEQARTQSKQWTLRVEPEVPVKMNGDPGRIRQVLGNLLSNALKFTPKRGQISLLARRTGTADGGSDRLLLEVKDSGVGIAPGHQAKIFDAFTQADASTSRRYGGSGLGLAICMRLVHLMGGDITLHSVLGQGSTFTVTLPLEEASTQETTGLTLPAALEADPGATPQFSGLRVLLAEDHAVNELLMQTMLSRLGCLVQVARNGNEAVSHWQGGDIDLVLMDVQMPECDGLEATRRIRDLEARQSRTRTPIVAVTASAMTGDREACLAAGMDSYTTKPVGPSALAQAIKWALQRTTTDPVKAPATNHTTAAPAVPAATDPLDLPKLRRRLDGNEATLRQLAQAMRTDLSQRLKQLQASLQTRDTERAIAHAHGLKGSLGSMTAERGARLAKGLELAARARDWALFERALPMMQVEARQIDEALNALLSERVPAAVYR